MKKTTQTGSPLATTNCGMDSITTKVESYRERLDRDLDWAMDEGERYFQGTSEAHKSLRRITQRLAELGINYMVVDSLAMFQHGYRQFTEDVHLLVTQDTLTEIHLKLVGSGYSPPFPRGKNLLDTENGVKIEFLVTERFPCDGKVKHIADLTPSEVAEEINGIRYINLTSLIELKLALGMADVARMKDLGDVAEMIKVLELPRGFACKLDLLVQEKYNELWDGMHPPGQRYVTFRGVDGADSSTKSTDELIALLSSNDESVRAMLADGVTIDRAILIAADEIRFVTNDPIVARRYDLHDESEFR
jgi:hypothetical protein